MDDWMIVLYTYVRKPPASTEQGREKNDKYVDKSLREQ